MRGIIVARDRTIFSAGLGLAPAELSFAGPLAPGLSTVVGLTWYQPRIGGALVDQGRIGKWAMGRIPRQLRAALEYLPPALSALSFDLQIDDIASRWASIDNRIKQPGGVLLTLGGRYRFTLAGAPASVCVQVFNVTDDFQWQARTSGAFTVNEARRFSITLAADF